MTSRFTCHHPVTLESFFCRRNFLLITTCHSAPNRVGGEASNSPQMQWILRLYGVLRMTLYLQVSSPSTYTACGWRRYTLQITKVIALTILVGLGEALVYGQA